MGIFLPVDGYSMFIDIRVKMQGYADIGDPKMDPFVVLFASTK